MRGISGSRSQGCKVDASVEPFKARRLYLVLRDQLRGGGMTVGTRLPGETDLASQHGVSRVTVRRALDALAMEGLIERRPGSGTYVRGPGKADPISGDVANLVAHIAEMGRSTTVRLLSFAYAPAPAAVTDALGLGRDARCQVSCRVRLIDGAPFSHLVTHVPERIGRSYAEAELATTPLLTLLERSGITVARATQTMTATLAAPDVATALDVAVGTPLLSVTRAVFDTTGRGVEHLAALYRPDRCAFRMDLLRGGAPDARTWQPVFTHADRSTDAANDPRTTGSPEP